MAALLDSSGQPLWTRRVTDAQYTLEVTATYTGDGFLWASRSNATDPLLARFELDGTMTTTTLALGTVDLYTQLVWTGTEARMFWEQSYIPLDRAGHALGAPRKVIDGDTAIAALPVQLGARTAVLLTAGLGEPFGPVVSSASLLGGFHGDYAGSGQRSLVVLDQNGAPQPPFVIFANGNQGPSVLRQLVPVKDHLLAAFVSYDERYHQDFALYLASIRP